MHISFEVNVSRFCVFPLPHSEIMKHIYVACFACHISSVLFNDEATRKLCLIKARLS